MIPAILAPKALRAIRAILVLPGLKAKLVTRGLQVRLAQTLLCPVLRAHKAL